MAMESRFTWMDGTLVPTEMATIPFLTSGLHFGLGAFEGIRCYATADGPAVFRLPEHSKRLTDSVRTLGADFRWSAAKVAKACVETVAANGFNECYIRPVAYVSQGGWSLSLVGATVSLGIAAWEWKSLHGDASAKGLRANVSSFTRHHPNVTMTKAKINGNYVNSVLARTESVKLGFDEAILLDPSGYVAECTGENLFIVRDRCLYTPGQSSILEGITRDSLMTLARDLGYDVRESEISRDQLYLADELFVCGTAAEVVAIREVDFRTVGNGEIGPVTLALKGAFHDAVRGKTPKYSKWLTPVAK